jgi:hypothetical protein
MKMTVTRMPHRALAASVSALKNDAQQTRTASHCARARALRGSPGRIASGSLKIPGRRDLRVAGARARARAITMGGNLN